MADRGGGGGGIFGGPGGSTSSFYFLICLALLFTVKDLFLNQLHAPAEEDGKGDGDVGGRGRGSSGGGRDMLTAPDLSGPGSRLSAGKVSGPSMKFMFWNVFEQFSQILLQRHPEILIEGENYPPPTVRRVGAQVLSVLKFLFLGCLFMGTNPFDYLGFGLGNYCLNVWTWMQGNKIYGSLMVFFVCNFIETQLISTGAFEIYFNDVPVWSKLQTGRIPSPPELLQIVDNHLKLMNSVDDFSL